MFKQILHLKIVYALLLFAFFISCKKENINVQFPENLYITKVESVPAVRLFTNKSEITDTTVINNFIDQSGYFNIQNQAIDSTERISFFTKDTVTFGSSHEKFSVEKSGNQFLFTSVSALVAANETGEMIRYKSSKIAISTASGIS